MISARETKVKIRSINNTKQITKAMEMVSASKMRKSQQVALNSRAYCEKALEILGNLSEHTDYIFHPLLQKREVKSQVLLVVTSDKGLCGGLNSNVLKKALKFFSGKKPDIIAVGKKGRDFFSRHNFKIAAEFTAMGDIIKIKETSPIAQLLIKLYLDGEYDSIAAVYTNFLSTLKQEAVLRQVLPVSIEGIKETVSGILPERGKYSNLSREELKEPFVVSNYEYLYEPNPELVLNSLLPDLLHIQVYHMILEANASEHSARMVAMKNASDSAQKLINDLTLFLNKVRQSAITKEISEITAGTEALQQ